MVRKPVKPKAKTKGQKKAQRQAKKHKAKHQALRIKVLFGPVARAWAKIPATFRLPGLKHPIEKDYAAVFVAVLVVGLSGGYLGVQVFSEGKTKTVNVIHQMLPKRDFILPEPSLDTQYTPRAYEEKVVDEVFEPEDPVAAQTSTPTVEVAKLAPPAIKHADEPLWMQNAIDFTPIPGKPMIAIVIDDMGVDRRRSKHMWEDVPGPLTLSFMTYANDLDAQTHAARSQGHEMMLHMSMEPSNPTIDAGPNVLITGMADAELSKLTNWGLDRFKGYVGVNNHMGSRFTENAPAMKVVLQQIQKRGLLFLDSRTSPKSVAGRVSQDLGLPTLVRNVFIDNDNEIDKVLKQMDEVERLARKRGVAIAIGHPREATIEALKVWVPEALNRGLSIVPISTVMRQHLATKVN